MNTRCHLARKIRGECVGEECGAELDEAGAELVCGLRRRDRRRDLLDDVIPTIESRYGTATGREQRALAGLSMGGGQALNFGLAHLDRFAWVGGFSSAPNTKPPAALIPDPAALKQLKLLWLSCGNKDGLIPISQGVHAYLKEQNVPHVWHVAGHGHDAPEWKQALYYFAQKLFK